MTNCTWDGCDCWATHPQLDRQGKLRREEEKGYERGLKDRQELALREPPADVAGLIKQWKQRRSDAENNGRRWVSFERHDESEYYE